MSEQPEINRNHQNNEYILYYDGDCPICNQFKDYLALKSHYERIKPLSLRDPDNLTHLMALTGKSPRQLSKSFHIVSPSGEVTSGSSVFQILEREARKSHHYKPSRVETIFRVTWLMKLVYPFLKGYRRWVLWLRGISPKLDAVLIKSESQKPDQPGQKGDL